MEILLKTKPGRWRWSMAHFFRQSRGYARVSTSQPTKSRRHPMGWSWRPGTGSHRRGLGLS